MMPWRPARCTRRPFLCEKGDSKKLNAFFKDFKLYLPVPDYASMQANAEKHPHILATASQFDLALPHI